MIVINLILTFYCFRAQYYSRPVSYPTYSGEPYTQWEIAQIEAEFESFFTLDTGAVVVSANERYHRSRDAAIAINVLMQMGEYSSKYDGIIENYVNFVAHEQREFRATAFDLMGNPYLDPHERGPQISGIAIRAIALIQYCDEKVGSASQMPPFIMQSVWPIVKKDLTYLHVHMLQPSYDFWGEMTGDHFMNKLMVRCAMYLGCKFADEQGDDDLQDQLEVAVDMFQEPIMRHWDDSKKFIMENLGARSVKASKLDTASLMASLYTVVATDGFFEPVDSKVHDTVEALVSLYESSTWPVAKDARNRGVPGVLLGRYVTFTSRPPYLTCTYALAEYYYTVAAGFFLSRRVLGASDMDLKPHRDILLRAGHLKPGERLTRANAVRGFRQLGDDQLHLVRHLIGINFPETINENGGESGPHLQHTWSYAAFFSAWIKRSMLPMRILSESRNLEATAQYNE